MTDDEFKSLRELQLRLRELRIGVDEPRQHAERRANEDERLQLENPYYSPNRVEGSWQATTR